MFGRFLPFFVGVSLLSGSGCSRTYDGTVVIPRPLDVRRFWDRPPPNVEYGQSQAESGAFPVAPQPPRRFSEATAPRRHGVAEPVAGQLVGLDAALAVFRPREAAGMQECQ